MISWKLSWGSLFDLGAFQRAQPLRRIPLDRGRAEFAACRYGFFLRRRCAAPAASARCGLPPRRAAPESRGHLGERGRGRAVLEAFEPAIEVGGGQMKASWQARGIEARRDLLHLADPDRKSTRLNSSHGYISYAVFCLKKKMPSRSRPSSSLSTRAIR